MDPAFLPPGTLLGPWRVVSRRGAGTYGVVYQVEPQEHAERPYALKLATTAGDARFEREGALLARIQHPHVPRLHDRGGWTTEGGLTYPYLVMDWAEGVGLYEWAAQHGLTSRQALRLLAQVARALEATHEVGGLHRDVKGDNVLVPPSGERAMLVDFGAGDIRGARRLTREVLPPGTLAYRSPEALRFEWRWGRHAAARYEAGPGDDVYALGVTAYRLVTGKYPPPIPPPEAVESCNAESFPARVPPEQIVTVSPELAALMGQMLSVDPLARGSAAQVAQRLEHAARTAGTEADQPILPRAASTSTVRTARQRRRLHAPVWLLLVGMVVGVTLTFNAGWGLRQSAGAIESAPEEHRDEAEDDANTGAGDSALPTPEAPSAPAGLRIGLEIPKKPFPGQHRPPCTKPAVEINGGCWAHMDGANPPCSAPFYEHKSRCYWPMISPPRPDTSGQP